MSATAVVDIQKTHPPATSKSSSKRRSKKDVVIPLLPHRPSPEVLLAAQQFAATLLRHGYNYTECLSIARFTLIDTALLNSRRIKTEAAKRLGISREHIRLYHERGAEMARK